jgi:hypothetical protein
MEISTNSTQYLGYLGLTASPAGTTDPGRDVPGAAADPATGPIAASATGSTPASQFSAAVLSQLIQAQSDAATGQTPDLSDPDNPQNGIQTPGQAAPGRGHRHHGHHHAQGAVQADAGALTSTGSSTDSSSSGSTQDPSLASTLLS